jgi:hypothetical protein
LHPVENQGDGGELQGDQMSLKKIAQNVAQPSFFAKIKT